MKNNLSGLCLRLADGERIAPVAVFHHITPLERRNALRAMEWEKGGTHMTILRWLEGLRTPWLDSLMAAVTELGDETVFMVAGLVILWCVNKRWGFRFLLTGLTGSVINQLLKGIFLIPRPWVLDPSFTIVESARAGATGYSFPSGHTQSAATMFGTLAMWSRRRWSTLLCVVMVLLVGFSRMYLGVHTPLDVGVSLLTGVVTVVLLCQLCDWAEPSLRRLGWLLAGCVGLALALLLYVLLAPAREANVPEFDAHGVKAAWQLMGAMAGLALAWMLDEKWVHFDTRAVWWAQALKLIVGLGLVLLVKGGLKPLFAMLFGKAEWTTGLRYFLVTLAGGALWPMTFGFFARLGRKKQAANV